MSPRREPAAALLEALRERKVLVVGGAGGVGKTTTAAALALQSALLGRRALVCTIDPSRRLATSLGLTRLSDRPRALDLKKVAPDAAGEMWAMTLDTKTTFDALVVRYAKDAEARERIFANRFYQGFSKALYGSHEYLATEKLLELTQDERFDLVILDTPPTRHALDFLDAPDRLIRFLDSSTLRFFLRPYFAAGRITVRIATRTGALAMKLVDSMLGMQFLQDLSEFFLALESMYDGFRDRAAKVQAMLKEPSSGFVLVTGPARATLDEARFFHDRLAEKQMPFVALIVNRLHPDPAHEPDPGGPLPRLDEELAAKLAAVHRDMQTLARAEAKGLVRLEVDTGQPPLLVPELEQDIHDLRGLREAGELILGARTLPRRRLRRTAGARA